MEEEYRNEKTAAEQQEKEKSASTTALRGTSPAPPSGNGSVNGDQIVGETEKEDSEEPPNAAGDDSEEGKDSTASDTPMIEKPGQTVVAEEAKPDAEEIQTPAENVTRKYTHLQNKRLCERWLDNLFMLLYEVCIPYN